MAFSLSRYFYTPMLPLMQEQFGFGNDLGGLIASFNLAGYLAGSLLATLARSQQARWLVLRAGVVTSALTTTAMGLSADPYVWMAIRSFAGVASAFALISAIGIISGALARTGSEARLGWVFSGVGLGIAGSGLVILLAAPYLDAPKLWMIAGLASIAVLPLIIRCVSDVQIEPQTLRSPLHPLEPFPFFSLLLSYSIGCICLTVFGTFIVVFLRASPEIEMIADWVWVIVGISAVPSALIAGKLAERIGYAKALLSVYLSQSAGILLPTLTDQPWAMLVMALIFGSTFMATPILVSALGRHGMGGRGFGALTFASGIGQAVSPLFVGLFATRPGSHDSILIATSLITLLASLIIASAIVMTRRRRERIGVDAI
jgi:predicted MFS family arabinose efflux permease